MHMMFQRNHFRLQIPASPHSDRTSNSSSSGSKQDSPSGRQTPLATHVANGGAGCEPNSNSTSTSEATATATATATAIATANAATTTTTSTKTKTPCKSAKLIIQSPCRRIVIAIATLRLISAPSTSSLTTSIGSLASLLKYIIAGCYYIIAFTSLLLLILYINHVVATQNIHDNNDTGNSGTKIEAQKERPLVMKSAALVYQIPTVKNNAEEEDDDDGGGDDGLASRCHTHNAVNRGKRSATVVEDNLSGQNQGKTSSKIQEHGFRTFGFGMRNSSYAHKQQIRQDSAILPIKLDSYTSQSLALSPVASSPLPVLTERQATSYINRAIMNNANSSSSLRQQQNQLQLRRQQQPTTERPAIESQWIPIVARPAREQPSNRANHEQSVSRPASAAGRQLVPAASQNYEAPIRHPTSGERSRARNHRPVDSRRPIQSQGQYRRQNRNQHQHNHHHGPAPSQHHRRYWRRPRFNVLNLEHNSFHDIRPKMYKRVLLCDKTLVSLDYVRNLDPEPRPFSVNHNFNNDIENDFDDAFNDIGATNLAVDQSYASRRLAVAGSSPVAPNTTSSLSVQPVPSSAESRAETMIETSASVGADGETHRSYLTDEDPLVECDMWDLEKGLKNRKPPRDVLRMAMRADFDTVRDAINRCRQLSEKTLPPDDEYRDGLDIMSTEDMVSLFSMKRGLIPGTKWCGLGDQASSYNDLGPKHRIDICCRAHDHCPIRLKPFRNDYGVLNIALYTKSHCDCDADFYRCLREVRSRTADMLGNLYFNVMKLQCMREERLKICREMKPIAFGFERCVKYEDSPVKTVFKFTTPPVAY